MDASMDEDSFPFFIPNANDTYSQLANLAGGLYTLALLEEEEIGHWQIHMCPYTRPIRVDYYLNTHEDVMFNKVCMDTDTFLQLRGLLEAQELLHGTQNMSADAQPVYFLGCCC